MQGSMTVRSRLCRASEREKVWWFEHVGPASSVQLSSSQTSGSWLGIYLRRSYRAVFLSKGPLEGTLLDFPSSWQNAKVGRRQAGQNKGRKEMRTYLTT